MKEPKGVGVGVASPPQPLAPSLARAGGVVAFDFDFDEVICGIG